jgi:hypothetical protein
MCKERQALLPQFTKSFCRLAPIVAVLFLLGIGAQSQTVKPSDPLTELNTAFRSAYGKRQAETLAQAGPIVLAEGDSLVLLHKGKREEAAVVPARYHELKVIAHIPLAIYVMCAPGTKVNLTTEKLEELRSYKTLVLAARTAIDKHGLPKDLLDRQHLLIDTSSKFIDAVVDKKIVTRGALIAFVQKTRKPVMENVSDSAKAQLDGMNAQMNSWRNRLTPEEWKQLRAVVPGPQMPRKENLAVQYFARLLGEPGEGRRIIYAESLWDEPGALKLLATHSIDSDIGVAFFGDGMRMHRDLLADAAKEHLQHMQITP